MCRGIFYNDKKIDAHIFCSYRKGMDYEWDEKKRQSNLEKHGENFADVVWLDWGRAHIEPDTRQDYGEARYTALVPRDDDRLMCLVFTPRGRRMRIISYRKANSREKKKYEAL